MVDSVPLKSSLVQNGTLKVASSFNHLASFDWNFLANLMDLPNINFWKTTFVVRKCKDLLIVCPVLAHVL